MNPVANLCAFFLMLASIVGSSAHGAPDSARLAIEAAYFADSENGKKGLVHGRFPITRPVHPFRKIIAEVMQGLALDDEETLRIEATGVALGTLYDYMENRMRLRRLRFTGATIEGAVTYGAATGGPLCRADFFGRIAARKGIPVTLGRDYREQAQLAPFEAAAREPGSFSDALAAVITAVRGPESPPTVVCVTP